MLLQARVPNSVLPCNCATVQPEHEGPREARPGPDRSNESYSLTHRLREQQSLVDQTSQPANPPAHRWTVLTAPSSLSSLSSLSRPVDLHLGPHCCLFVHGVLCPNVTAQLRADGSTSRNAADQDQDQDQDRGQQPATSTATDEQAAPTANSTLLWPRPAPHCLVLVARHLDEEHDNGRCVSTIRYSMHCECLLLAAL